MAKKTRIPTLGTGPTNQATMSMVPTPETAATHPETGSQPLPGTGIDHIAPAKAPRKRRTVGVTNRTPTAEELAAIAPAPKAPKGLDREAVLAAIRATGLALHEKGSLHAGGQLRGNGKTLDGARLVVPPSRGVTRLYVYKLPQATGIAGWLPEERRPGAVTHQADNPSWEQFRAMLTAVCEANGIELKQDGTPRAKRARKNTPALGVPVTDGEAGK